MVIALAAAAAYANSLSCPFTFDDQGAIIDNPSIRHLWPIARALWAPARSETGGRPLMNLSFAVNYALGGMNVWGYHAVNLAIHILAGLTLYGLVRRTLDRMRGTGFQPVVGNEHGLKAHATFLALAIALIWTLHPLQTEAVTYISERAESLMGLFYLLTLYGFVRYADESESGRRKAEGGNTRPSRIGKFSLFDFRFPLFSLSACYLGMATKEVMVTAPVVVLLYDRTFVSGTFAEAWRRRWKYYVALAGSWLLLGLLLKDMRQRGVGLDLGGSWENYALTECRVLIGYLRLAAWPHPLIFDRGMGVKPPGWEVLPYVVLVAALGAGSAWALFGKFRTSYRAKRQVFQSDIRNLRALGFAGVWVLLILSPTSSVVPISGQPMAEHRMYLPLAAVVAVIACGLGRYAGKWSIPALLAVAAILGGLTWQRNETYRSVEGIWTDTVAKCPNNERAHYNLGYTLFGEGQVDGAITEYEAALRLNPGYVEAHCNLGNAFNAEGRVPEAVAEYEAALRLKPDTPAAHNDLGYALNAEGRTREAIVEETEALRLDPDSVEAHNNLANALAALGRVPEAIAQYREALRLNPDYPDAHNNLGCELENVPGRRDEAIAEIEAALRLKPDYAEAHCNLGDALDRIPGRLDDAIAEYREALHLKPEYAEAHNNLGNALNAAGRLAEAAAQYGEALRLRPDSATIHLNLAGVLLRTPGRAREAEAELETVLRLDPGNVLARQILASLRLR